MSRRRRQRRPTARKVRPLPGDPETDHHVVVRHEDPDTGALIIDHAESERMTALYRQAAREAGVEWEAAEQRRAALKAARRRRTGGADV